jgi:hypothetical protein
MTDDINTLVEQLGNIGLDIEPERCDPAALRLDAAKMVALAGLLERDDATIFNPTTPEFRRALRAFKDATAWLSKVWDTDKIPGDVFGSSYPAGLPDFTLFDTLVQLMVPEMKIPDLPAPPAAGTIVRARHDLDCGGQGTWPKGWSGEVLSLPGDGNGYDDCIEVRCHRYLGKSLHEWDNCRVISLEDGLCAVEHTLGLNAEQLASADVPQPSVTAAAFYSEFEVIN